jgi:general stress protein YciG
MNFSRELRIIRTERFHVAQMKSEWCAASVRRWLNNQKRSTTMSNQSTSNQSGQGGQSNQGKQSGQTNDRSSSGQKQDGKDDRSSDGERGFAAMNPQEQREISRKGGEAVSEDRGHMAEIGRKGGEATAERNEGGNAGGRSSGNGASSGSRNGDR